MFPKNTHFFFPWTKTLRPPSKVPPLQNMNYILIAASYAYSTVLTVLLAEHSTQQSHLMFYDYDRSDSISDTFEYI